MYFQETSVGRAAVAKPPGTGLLVVRYGFVQRTGHGTSNAHASTYVMRIARIMPNIKYRDCRTPLPCSLFLVAGGENNRQIRTDYPMFDGQPVTVVQDQKA